MTTVDHRLAELAAAQHGVFTREQARHAGLSSSAISKRVARGSLVVVGAVTLRLPSAEPTWRSMLTTGLLELGPQALVSGSAAAQLHDLDGFHHDVVEFLVPRSLRSRKTVGRVSSTGNISRLDRCAVDGLACTSATRTVVEILRTGSVADASQAVDSACRRRLTAHAVIDRRLRELGRQGRRGVAAFEELSRVGQVESWLERRFVEMLGRAGLPLPEIQQRHQLPGVGVARVDFEYPLWGVVIEVGGSRGYLSRDERQQQQRRRNALQLDGKTVYFFTHDDVVDDEPYVVRTIATALEFEPVRSTGTDRAG